MTTDGDVVVHESLRIELPTGTIGHPADLPVNLVVRADDWSILIRRIPVPGRHGTIDVDSSAPDPTRFTSASHPTTD